MDKVVMFKEGMRRFTRAATLVVITGASLMPVAGAGECGSEAFCPQCSLHQRTVQHSRSSRGERLRRIQRFGKQLLNGLKRFSSAGRRTCASFLQVAYQPAVDSTAGVLIRRIFAGHVLFVRPALWKNSETIRLRAP